MRQQNFAKYISIHQLIIYSTFDIIQGIIAYKEELLEYLNSPEEVDLGIANRLRGVDYRTFIIQEILRVNKRIKQEREYIKEIKRKIAHIPLG